MDNKIHNIKMSVWLVSSPDRHTVHKTMRAPCCRHEQALKRVYKPPPEQRPALCGLLNGNLMAVDFTNYRKTGRLFLFFTNFHDCRFVRLDVDRQIAYYPLSTWQCYIAKYP